MNEVENHITDLEHKEAKNNESEQHEEKRIQKNEDGVSDLWDNFKRYNIHIIGVPEEEIEQEIGNLLEKIMKTSFPHLTCKSRKHRVSQTRWVQISPLQDTS